MRLIQVTVPIDKREDVLGVLDEEGVDYVVTEETESERYDSVLHFPLPDRAVEPIMDDLHEVGVDKESYTVVTDAQTVVSEGFEELVEEYPPEDMERDQISRQELMARADELTPTFPVFLAMTIISVVVATVGLLLDSAAVVVGSMVIAPLIGPSLAASIGTILNERGLFRLGAKYQAGGVIVGIAAAAAFAWLLQTLLLVPPGTEINQIGELAERLSPDLLLLPVALGAGSAGVLSLALGFSMAIVGVMIAAALVPPIAAAGIAIAWGLPTAALGSGVIVLVNLFGINLAGLVTLWYLGYRPTTRFEITMAHRQMLKQVVVLGVTVVLLSAFMAGVTYTSYQVSAFEGTAEREAEAVLEDYDRLELLSVEAEIVEGRGPTYGIGTLFHESDEVDLVTAEVGGPPGTYEPSVADRLHDRIDDETEANVTVRVTFVASDERTVEGEGTDLTESPPPDVTAGERAVSERFVLRGAPAAPARQSRS